MAVSLTIVGTRDLHVEDLVRGSGRISNVAWVSDLRALIDADAEQPDVLLIDVRGGQRLPVDLAGLKRQHPATNVMLLASALDPSLMLEGMRAGISEYLTQPLKQEEVDAAIARLLGQRSQSAGTHVFAFIGAKGGVGTTTTAVNVAAVLAKLSKNPTLLVDLHLAYGDAAVFLGAEPRFSLLDALENMHRLDAEFLKSLVVRAASSVELLASADRPATAAVNMRNVDAIVRLASSQYSYTVLDVPRSDLLVLDCLDRVDTMVVVANQELATVRNAGHLTAALRSRYPDAKVITVINKFDAGAEISQRDVQKALGTTIAHEFPNDYRLALSAMHKGRPLAVDNHNQLSASMTALARELAGIKQEKTEKSPGGLKALLSGRR